MALASLALAVFLAWHHPLLPIAMTIGAALWAAVVFVWPGLWLFVVPAVLPVIGLAPWTGWLTFEELDIVVLAAAAGGYAAVALRAGDCNAGEACRARLSLVALLVLGLFGASEALALYRGLAAAGSYSFGWFHGYGDALNSLRAVKSFPMVLLVAPLVVIELRKPGTHAAGTLAAGMAFGLGVAALAVVWERLVFADLLDFSSDYRVTALFWEMHVGGAALDGFLVLTVPFGALQLVRARGLRQLATALALAALASYACLVTFSRGLYLAVPVSLGVMTILLIIGQPRGGGRVSGRGVLRAALAVPLAIVGASLVFRAGGYRTLLAVLAVAAAMLPLRGVVRSLPAGIALVTFLSGAMIGLVGAAVGTLLQKGVYVAFGLAFVVFVSAMLRQRAVRAQQWPVVALGAYGSLIVLAAAVALSWGGWDALRDASIVLLGLLALTCWNIRAAIPLWSEALPAQGAVFAMAALLAATVAVFSGGAYMGTRFASVQQDLSGRLWHWGDSLGMMRSSDSWVLGRGAGRFPADYAKHFPKSELPGGYALNSDDGVAHLTLSGPGKPTGTRQALRLAQRIPIEPGQTYSVVLHLRARAPTYLLIELCEKNLLYTDRCAAKGLSVKPSAPDWQRVVVQIDGRQLSGARWYLPRLGLFSLAVDTSRTTVDFRQVSVFRSDGRDLLANGDWSGEMAHWFFTSDREHLPWHMKNLALHVLFEQGAVGVLLFGLLLGVALWRVTFGVARHASIAPALAASLTGFLVVGLFDSLLDAPRVAFLFYLLVLTALALSETRPQDTTRAPATVDRSRTA